MNENDIFNKEIRPQYLKEYVGQMELKSNLNIFINGAKYRNESLDHVLLYGPPGLGKTTLAYIISNEMKSKIHIINGPSIEKAGDLAMILTTLEEGDVLFIDEIHRLPKQIEEILYSVMEDFKLITITSENNFSNKIELNIPPFTLIGATTRPGMISPPLRARFGISLKFNYYNLTDLSNIIKRSGIVLNCKIDEKSAYKIARRSRGTPRIANRIFKRVRDFANANNSNEIDIDLCSKALKDLKIDDLGLDEIDIKILKTIITRYNGGPVGINSIATSIGEDSEIIEDVYEPYLIQIGLINRTLRGRVITQKGLNYIKLNYS